MTSLLFLVGGLALLLVGGSGSSSSHSMRNFYSAVSEPSQGLPQFIAVGYVDDQPIARYDSNTKRKVPVVPWMRKVEQDDPLYWQRYSQVLQGWEQQFRVDLRTLRGRYNQNSSTGLHTWQWMYGCEVGPDGRPRGGYWQFGYDGEDFLTLDKETLTWTARVPQALITKERWDKGPEAQRFTAYTKEECAEWLRRYLDYGNETLRRTERPTVKVARKERSDGQETLVCQAHGFYPKEIDITWTKDGEDQWQDTFHGGVAPNSDGTYTKYVSIEVEPNERGHYRCRVGHNSVLETLDLAWEEPASNVGLIVGILVGVLAAIAVVAGVVYCMSK
ncbi:BOLA class I histocompatibility antigen, alpha chain BL3-7-like [Eublepharis macularius]|uniref:BOLA class I histocompatibility antigen, alpha chain BL3-7-like n=1 Tax=Eublepharis macularius TaxID=481883 RepID=A0AA97J9J0_EUBMA|nr:BOLA class I histocompatibility antigen, alpha chain BL3-7-like [Eublepharis macularius]